MTKAAFVAAARRLTMTLRGNLLTLEPRRFRSGSVGWRWAGEVVEVLDGEPVRCLVAIQITARGSGKWPEDEEAIPLVWSEAGNQ
jgi:hypothetical protein